MTTVRDLAAIGVVTLLLLITTQGVIGFVCNTHGNFCIDKTHYGICVEQDDGTLLPDETRMYKCAPEGTVCVSTSDLPCEVPSVQPTETPAPPSEFYCAEAGKFAYPEDCTKYNKCYMFLFKMHHKVNKCFLGFGFSTEKGKCVLKSKSDCSSTGVEGDFVLESEEDKSEE